MTASAKHLIDDNLQILVVDDEPSVRRGMKLVLEHHGHQVSEAGDAEVALGQFAEGKFDLVITDFFMPGMRGDELVTRIRQLSPKQPIVLTSGCSDESEFGQLSNNSDAFLQKPFSLKSLREVVDRVVRRGQASGKEHDWTNCPCLESR